MPKALDPNYTFDVVLDSDKHKPKAKRPTFVYRALNGREWLRFANLADAAELEQTAAESMELLFSTLKTGLINWKHMQNGKGLIKFDPEKLIDIIDPNEGMELLNKVTEAATLTRNDKKKSD